MCHLYPYNNVKLLWKFFYINLGYGSLKVIENGTNQKLGYGFLFTFNTAVSLAISP